MEEILAKAVPIDGRKEWYCVFCSELGELREKHGKEIVGAV